MTSPSRTEPPESLGPGTDDPAGSGQVIYGVAAPRPSLAADHRPLREPVANPRCDRCMDLPDDLVIAAVAALRTAARQGRPR
jgi:hypothetical protein